MDSETPQTKEVSPTKGAEIINEDKTPESGQMETKDDAAAAGGGHEDKSDSDTAAEMEEAAGDSTTAASTVAIINDTKEPEGEKIGGGSSPQAEGDKDDAKRDEDTPESDSKKVQSESETEKVPLDAESGEEKEEELPYKVRFDVSRESTEAADEETKVDPTAVAATDTEQGVGTPTKQPLSSIESEHGKEPVWYSRTSLLITSVFSIFCFFPMGIVALYYGMKVKDIYHSKHEAAEIKDYARRSTFCSVAAITTGIIALLLILLVIILGITGVVQ